MSIILLILVIVFIPYFSHMINSHLVKDAFSFFNVLGSESIFMKKTWTASLKELGGSFKV